MTDRRIEGGVGREPEQPDTLAADRVHEVVRAAETIEQLDLERDQQRGVTPGARIGLVAKIVARRGGHRHEAAGLADHRRLVRVGQLAPGQHQDQARIVERHLPDVHRVGAGDVAQFL